MKNILKYTAIGLMLLSTSACGTIFDLPQKTTTIELPTVTPNLPNPPVLNNVTWQVYSANDLKNLANNDPNIILFTLTQDQNKALNSNIVELQRYILQLKQTVKYYQNLNTPAKK